MNTHCLSLLFLFTLLACKNSVDVEAEYAQLKDNQTRFISILEGNPFYEKDAIFTGHLDARENYFSMNFFNQYGGNFMVTLDGKNWYNHKKLEGKGGGDFSNLMVGKVIDAKKNKGVGYLMSKGDIEPIVFSKSKMVFKMSGKMKKYPKVNPEDPTYDFEGYIISKNPTFDIYLISR